MQQQIYKVSLDSYMPSVLIGYFIGSIEDITAFICKRYDDHTITESYLSFEPIEVIEFNDEIKKELQKIEFKSPIYIRNILPNEQTKDNLMAAYKNAITDGSIDITFGGCYNGVTISRNKFQQRKISMTTLQDENLQYCYIGEAYDENKYILLKSDLSPNDIFNRNGLNVLLESSFIPKPITWGGKSDLKSICDEFNYELTDEHLNLTKPLVINGTDNDSGFSTDWRINIKKLLMVKNKK